MRLLTLAICLIGLTALGQGSVRRANSLTNLLATVDPANVATGGKVTYLVPGYYDDIDWGGDREITATKTPGATNLGRVWRSPLNTNWFWRAPASTVDNALFWGVRNDGVTDNASNFLALLAYTNSMSLPRGKMLTSSPLIISNAYPIRWVSELGSFQGGWIAADPVVAAELVYTGPTVPVFADFSVGMDSTGTNQMRRLGHRIENVTFNANSNAAIALKVFRVGRGTHDNVRAFNATGTNQYYNDCQFFDIIKTSSSRNDQYPRPIATPKYGIVIDYCQVMDVRQLIAESATEYGIGLFNGTALCDIDNSTAESLYGGGVVIGTGCFQNSLRACWTENNHPSSNWLWIQAGAYQNDITRFKMEKDYSTNPAGTPIGYFRIDGSYNTISRSKIGNAVITGVRNEFNRNFYNTNAPWSDLTGGNQYINHIDETVTYRTNTFDAPFVVYGDYIKLWNNHLNPYPNTILSPGGIGFGSGTADVDGGWFRYSAASMATSNSIVLFKTGANDGLLSAYVYGDTYPRVSWNMDGTWAAGPGGASSTDVSIGRYAAGSWYTPNQLLFFGTTTNSSGPLVGVTGDAYMRVSLDAAGRASFGSGSAPRDAYISYDSPNTVRVNNNLVIANGLTLGGVQRTTWPTDALTLQGQNGAYYLSRANHTGTQAHTTITGLGTMATINDAPSDGNQYGRKNGAWDLIVAGGGATNVFSEMTNILIAGANVTLTVDSTNKTITISATSGGGATNGTTLSVNGGAALTLANINSTTGIAVANTGTNITFSVVDRDFGDVTVSSSGTVFTIDADSVALGTDTTGDYVASVTGTANEVTASGSGEGAAVTISLPATIDLGGKTSFELPNAAAPTVDAFGEIAGDNDAWAAGRGAPSFYDGTATVWLLGTLASDTPSNGQVPKWNTGGTITWENDTTGSGGSSTNILVNTNLVTEANFIDSSTAKLQVDGSKIQIIVSNTLPTGWYGNGFLPLYAGVSNMLTGDLFRKQNSDIREPMWEDGTEWNAVGLRANGGKLSLAEYNTNDWTVLEEFMVVDPTDTTDDIITFGNSGFNNRVVFEADVTLEGALTVNGDVSGLTEIATLLPQNSQPPSSSYATFATRNSIGVLEFDASAQEATRWVIALPKKHTYSSGVSIVIEWCTTATSGDGRWGARIQKLSAVDIDSDSFATAVEGTTTTSGTAGLVNRTTLSAVGVDSAAAGDLVQIEVYRDVGDAADTINSNDLQILAVVLEAP